MNMLVLLWALFALIFVILEIGHPGLLFFLSLSFGSSFAAILAWLSYPLEWQITSFFAASFFALMVLRLFLKKIHGSSHHTNVYALIGKKGIVIDPVGHTEPGYIKVAGEVWLARSLSQAPLPSGCMVIIVDVRGAHVIVEESHIR